MPSADFSLGLGDDDASHGASSSGSWALGRTKPRAAESRARRVCIDDGSSGSPPCEDDFSDAEGGGLLIDGMDAMDASMVEALGDYGMDAALGDVGLGDVGIGEGASLELGLGEDVSGELMPFDDDDDEFTDAKAVKYHRDRDFLQKYGWKRIMSARTSKVVYVHETGRWPEQPSVKAVRRAMRAFFDNKRDERRARELSGQQKRRLAAEQAALGARPAPCRVARDCPVSPPPPSQTCWPPSSICSPTAAHLGRR